MNRRKISHLVLVLVLVCSAWLPAAIDISKARIGAVTDEQFSETVETNEELQESEEAPILDGNSENLSIETVETNEELQESEEAPILDGNSENLSIEQLDQSFIFEDEVNSSSRSSVIVATEESFTAAWNNEEVSEIILSKYVSVFNVRALAERTSDLTISSTEENIYLAFGDSQQQEVSPKWKDSTVTIVNTGFIVNGVLDIPEGNLHYIVNNHSPINGTYFILGSNGLSNIPEGRYGRIKNFVMESDIPKEPYLNGIVTRAFMNLPVTILENMTLRGGGLGSGVRSSLNPKGAKASITVLGTTTLYEDTRISNSNSGNFTGEPFPVLSTFRLVRPVDEPLGIWTSKPKNPDRFVAEPDRSWRNANFIMEDGVIIESSNNSITDENFKLSEIWFIDSVSSDLWVPPSLDEIELTVRYVNENSGEEISSSDISLHGIGSKVELDDRGNDLFEDGYDFSEVSIDPKTIDFNPDTNTITIPDEDVTVTFYYKKAQGEVTVNYQDINGVEIQIPDRIEGDVFSQYDVNHPDITGYAFHGLREDSAPVNGIFKREVQNIIFIYTVGDPGIVSPVDPLNPDITVDPDNKPEIPEDQGLLSIDFVSQFDFGTSYISASSQTYHAKSQRLLNEDGSVNLVEERPNFVQISDRRLAADRAGWELSVTQASQFMNSNEEELRGAQLKLENQQLVTAQGGTAPEIVRGDRLDLIPGSRQNLLLSKGDEGTGTWVYRFGDANTGAESVKLEVPEGTNPSATTYRTTLIWEISAIPQN